MYMEKLCASDWLKTCAFSCNTSARLKYKQITDSMPTLSKFCLFWLSVMFFSHTLLTSNMMSSAIWCNKHLQIFQRLQIAFALQAKAICTLHQIYTKLLLKLCYCQYKFSDLFLYLKSPRLKICNLELLNKYNS